MTNKILEGFCNQFPSLIDFDVCRIGPKFASELQRKEYEQALRDVHFCKDRRALIHSKKGLEIVILYMRVWQIGPQQAIRELITDEDYAEFIYP